MDLIEPQFILAALIWPGFLLAGLALASIPVAIHLLNRRRFRTVPWAAMDFLLQAVRRNRRRQKFEHWTLMAARCGVLGLLGLALARPTGCGGPAADAIGATRTGLHVIVIDDSLSMGYRRAADNQSGFERARDLAGKLVGTFSRGGESVAVIVASKPASVAVETTFALDSAAGAIAALAQTSQADDLPSALRQAIRLARDAGAAEPRTLHVLTDSATHTWEGPDSQELASIGPELAGLFEINHYSLASDDIANAAVTQLAAVSPLITTLSPADLTATVTGVGNVGQLGIQWSKADRPISGETIVSPDADGETVQQNGVRFEQAGPQVVRVGIDPADRLPADDQRWAVVSAVSELPVLVVEGDPSPGPLGGSGAFLATALSPGSLANPLAAADRTSPISVEVISDLELTSSLRSGYRAVFMTDVSEVSEPQADALAAFVAEGGTLVWFMGESVDADAYNRTLLPRQIIPGPLVGRMSGGQQGGFRFSFDPSGVSHPLLQAFRGQPRSGLDTALVTTYLQCEPRTGAERVLDFLPAVSGEDTRSADPAITAHALGLGRVVWNATTADADWTNLPAKPAYVTLVHELLLRSLDSGVQWMNLTVGESVQTPRDLRLSAVPKLTDPFGKERSLVPSSTGDRFISEPLREPGLYRITAGSVSVPVAVNVPAGESDLTPVDNARIVAALGGIKLAMLADALPERTESAAEAHDYGWPILLAVLALAATESLMALWFGHHPIRTVGGEAA